MSDRTEYFNIAVGEFQKSNYTTAISLFEKALQKPFLGCGNMTDDLIFNNIATCYNKLMNYEKSIDFYTKAINCGLTNDDVYFSLAASYHRAGKNEEALSIYNFLIDRTPRNGKAYYLRGKIHQIMGCYLRGSNDLGIAASLNYYG